LEFAPLLVIDGDKVQVGTPTVDGAKVTAEIVEADQKADKVKVLKYKAKKRQHTLTGHRQHQSVIKIKKISTK
jgi:large subunit ribosomal protein L21